MNSAFSHLLDPQTYAQVIANSPDIQAEDLDLARRCVQVLRSFTTDFKTIQTFEISLADFTRNTFNTDPEQPASPKNVGRILRDLGITKLRRRDGYHVLWTSRQVSILASFFAVEV